MKGRVLLATITLAAILAMAFIPAAVLASGGYLSVGSCTVDIGNVSSETQTGVSISGWGPIEPATNGGTWGNIAPGDCRVIWDSSDNDPTANVTYVYDSCVYPTDLSWRVLTGSANDSYDVYVDGTLVYSFVDENYPSEESWNTIEVDLSSFSFPNDIQHIVEFVATGEAWNLFQTYGQVAIDTMTFTTAPCVGNGNVDVNVTVLNPDCICINVSPSSINFGSLYPGQNKDIPNALNVSNCGNVKVDVTVSSPSAFYTANLLLDSLSLAAWEDTLGISALDSVDAHLNVPTGATPGAINSQIVFWAVKSP